MFLFSYCFPKILADCETIFPKEQVLVSQKAKETKVAKNLKIFKDVNPGCHNYLQCAISIN